MTEAYDFEKAWLEKFSNCVEETAGPEVRREVMEGSEGLTDRSSREEVIDWTQRAMARLETLAGEERAQEVMTGCACQFPKSGLKAARETYAATGDLDRVHGMLQEQFEVFLRDTLALEEELVEVVVRRGWGLAGVMDGDRIVATKIPKSGYLVAYLEETDAEKRRQIYCHCPRIRDVLKTSENLAASYCYCGAGYYQGIWEEILQQPVRVEVVESVLQGDEVCSIAIHLPTA